MYGVPKTHTSLAARTTPPPISRLNVCITVQVLPFQRRAVELVAPSANAHTLPGDVAEAATTDPPRLSFGNGTGVQADPLRCHAAVPATPLNAQPPSRPTAVTAVNWPLDPLCTCSTMCHDACASGLASDGPANAPATPKPKATASVTTPKPVLLPRICPPSVVSLACKTRKGAKEPHKLRSRLHNIMARVRY